MKRQSILRNPPGILQKSEQLKRLHTPNFTGFAALMTAHQVQAPLIKHKFLPEPYQCCILDRGYAWFTLLPDAGHLAITGIFDEAQRLMQVYVDVIAGQGIQDGIPFFDDLYADIILFEGSRVLVDDLDELLAAKNAGEITAQTHQMALEQSEWVRASMQAEPQKWMDFVMDVRKHFEEEAE